MKKILRNMSTEESRVFWESAERTAAVVEQWPAWKRAGINVVQVRSEERRDASAASDEQLSRAAG
jgi:hypothetical protein